MVSHTAAAGAPALPDGKCKHRAITREYFTLVTTMTIVIVVAFSSYFFEPSFFVHYTRGLTVLRRGAAPLPWGRLSEGVPVSTLRLNRA